MIEEGKLAEKKMANQTKSATKSEIFQSFKLIYRSKEFPLLLPICSLEFEANLQIYLLIRRYFDSFPPKTYKEAIRLRYSFRAFSLILPSYLTKVMNCVQVSYVTKQ